MRTWAPLWSPIVESSLWEEPPEVCKVFMTMLATKNSDHVCELDAYRIAKMCNFRLPDGSVDELMVLECLKVLASPDTRRKIKQEHEGRRIKAVEDGWLVLNGAKYREMVQKEMRKASWRRAQEKQRKKKAALAGDDGKPASGAYKSAEAAAVAEYERSGTGEAAPLNAG